MNPINNKTSYFSEKITFPENPIADKAWRHTIGRVSCAMRIPIYLIATGALAVKMTLRGIATPFIGGGAWLLDKEAKSFSPKAVGTDLAFLGICIDKTIGSLLGVICAPPKNYQGLDMVTHKITQIVYNEKANELLTSTPYEILQNRINNRTRYSESILDAYGPPDKRSYDNAHGMRTERAC